MYAEIKKFRKSKTLEMPVWTSIKIIDEEEEIEYTGSLSIIYKDKEFQVDFGHKMSVLERLIVLIELYSKLIYLGNVKFIEFKLNDLNNNGKYNNNINVLDELFKRSKNALDLNDDAEFVLNEVRESFNMIEKSLNKRNRNIRASRHYMF